jgi:type I restriction enzyme M protein
MAYRRNLKEPKADQPIGQPDSDAVAGVEGLREDTTRILDEVFGDPEVKHGLRVFAAGESEKIRLYRKNGKYYVRCLARSRMLVAKPEEIVRQLLLVWIRDSLDYPLSQVRVEEPVQMGAEDTRRADVVIFTDDTCTRKYMIFEVKKPDSDSGLEQMRSYLNATGVFFGAWSNGRDIIFQLREEDPKTKGEPYAYRDIPRLPRRGEALDDILKPLTKGDLRPIHDLKSTILRLEHDALANAGVNAFDELFKLLFAKLHDEFDPRKRDNSPMEFRVPRADPDTIYERINGLFQKATARKGWNDIFDPHEELKLRDEALILCASALEPLRFHDADLDVIDAAFEYLINPEQKPQKGQYFTPRPVVKMAVKMLTPKVDELVIDPACGSCGFLIHTINWVKQEQEWEGDLDAVFRYASEHLFAVDFDDRLKKVAKTMMLIAGDGKANVYCVDALDYRKWARSPAARPIGPFARDVRDGGFDVVMTNPPFAGKITGREQLSAYDLYDLLRRGELREDEEQEAEGKEPANSRRSMRRVNSMKRDILFIERCLRLLRPGGRMAIVLPQGNLNNMGTRALRDWIADRARILAVVGLHVNTFKPFTGTKTSLLFLQKWGEEAGPPLADYPIFMGTSRKSGKNNSGEYVPLTDTEGHLVDPAGRRVDPAREKAYVDHDLDCMADAFIAFARKEGLSFWR